MPGELGLQALTSEGPPQCIQIKPNQTGKIQYFLSACINTAFLILIQLRKYPSLRGKSKAGALAVKLAREAFFGEEVLAQCSQWPQAAPSLTLTYQQKFIKHDIATMQV